MCNLKRRLHYEEQDLHRPVLRIVAKFKIAHSVSYLICTFLMIQCLGIIIYFLNIHILLFESFVSIVLVLIKIYIFYNCFSLHHYSLLVNFNTDIWFRIILSKLYWYFKGVLSFLLGPKIDSSFFCNYVLQTFWHKNFLKIEIF